MSSLFLLFAALMSLLASGSSACGSALMFCTHKCRASDWQLPSGSAFSYFSLKITFIQPLPSASLPSSASIGTLPSQHWSLQMTRLCAFSACGTPGLLSPKSSVLCPCSCPSLCHLARQAHLAILLCLFHLLPELLQLLSGWEQLSPSLARHL